MIVLQLELSYLCFFFLTNCITTKIWGLSRKGIKRMQYGNSLGIGDLKRWFRLAISLKMRKTLEFVCCVMIKRYD